MEGLSQAGPGDLGLRQSDCLFGRGLGFNWQTISHFLIVWATCFFVYVANGRYIGAGDCVPAMYLPIALTRGDGPWLDRFRSELESPDGRLPGFCEESQGHVVSRYPVGPGLVITPLVIPQVLLWDVVEPGWDSHSERFQALARRITKTAAAAIAGLSMALLWLWLRSKVDGTTAGVATLTAAFGSGMWSTASQAGWQHGPAVFCLMVSIVCLEFLGCFSFGAAIAGFFAAMIVVCRTVDLPLSAALWLYSIRLNRQSRWAFTLSAAAVATFWVGWNLYFFDHLTGGYSEIEKMHGWAHGVKGSWSTPFATGLIGTLLSPSHGLLVYSPWVVFAFLGVIKLWREKELKNWGLISCLSLSLPVILVMFSKYSCWWAGHCFGARFWIDSTPVFSLLVAVSMSEIRNWPKSLRKSFMTLLILSVIWSMSLQLIAAFSYPTDWHSSPTNVDKDHQRLWDWQDNEVTRGLRQGPHRRQWSGL